MNPSCRKHEEKHPPVQCLLCLHVYTGIYWDAGVQNMFLEPVSGKCINTESPGFTLALRTSSWTPPQLIQISGIWRPFKASVIRKEKIQRNTWLNCWNFMFQAISVLQAASDSCSWNVDEVTITWMTRVSLKVHQMIWKLMRVESEQRLGLSCFYHHPDLWTPSDQ